MLPGCCRAFYDADDLDAARRWLQKALHLAPAQPMLRFNIAAVIQVHQRIPSALLFVSRRVDNGTGRAAD